MQAAAAGEGQHGLSTTCIHTWIGRKGRKKYTALVPNGTNQTPGLFQETKLSGKDGTHGMWEREVQGAE